VSQTWPTIYTLPTPTTAGKAHNAAVPRFTLLLRSCSVSAVVKCTLTVCTALAAGCCDRLAQTVEMWSRSPDRGGAPPTGGGREELAVCYLSFYSMIIRGRAGAVRALVVTNFKSVSQACQTA